MSAIDRLPAPPCDIEYVRLRCRMDGDCWLWSGHKKEGKLPTAWFRRLDVNGERKDFEVHIRQLVVWLTKGVRPNFFREVYRPTCGHDDCVNPKHMKRFTKSKMSEISNSSKSITAWANVAAGRRKASKLSDEAVKVIRESNLPGREIGPMFGITQQYVSLIRAGANRRDYSNPFSGLLA